VRFGSASFVLSFLELDLHGPCLVPEGAEAAGVGQKLDAPAFPRQLGCPKAGADPWKVERGRTPLDEDLLRPRTFRTIRRANADLRVARRRLHFSGQADGPNGGGPAAKAVPRMTCSSRVSRPSIRAAEQPHGVEPDLAPTVARGTALEREGPCPRRMRGRSLGWQVQMEQGALDGSRLVDERDQPKAPPTTQALEHIEVEGASPQRCLRRSSISHRPTNGRLHGHVRVLAEARKARDDFIGYLVRCSPTRTAPPTARTGSCPESGRAPFRVELGPASQTRLSIRGSRRLPPGRGTGRCTSRHPRTTRPVSFLKMTSRTRRSACQRPWRRSRQYGQHRTGPLIRPNARTYRRARASAASRPSPAQHDTGIHRLWRTGS